MLESSWVIYNLSSTPQSSPLCVACGNGFSPVSSAGVSYLKKSQGTLLLVPPVTPRPFYFFVRTPTCPWEMWLKEELSWNLTGKWRNLARCGSLAKLEGIL